MSDGADGALRVEIEDDGVGLPASYRAGIGIASMRERATELGGSCTIEQRQPQGTLVRAIFPLGLAGGAPEPGRPEPALAPGQRSPQETAATGVEG